MTKHYTLENLCCANCAAKFERKLSKVKGVDSAVVNFMMKKLTVECDETALPEIMAEAEKILRKLEPQAAIQER